MIRLYISPKHMEGNPQSKKQNSDILFTWHDNAPKNIGISVRLWRIIGSAQGFFYNPFGEWGMY